MNSVPTFILKLKLILIIFCCAHTDTLTQWSNLISAPTYGFYINPKNPSNIYVGGLGRRLYRTDNGGITWDTLIVEFENSTSRFTNVLVSNEDTSVVLVAGLGFGTVRRSSDRGTTWQIVIETSKPFSAPGEVLLQQTEENSVMLAGEFTSKIIFMSKNEGSTWDSIGKIMPGYDLNLCTLTQRLDSTNVLYGGCTPGTVVRSEDMGKSWRIISRLVKNEYGDAEIPRIIVSKQNPAIMYAVVTYFLPLSKPNGGIYLSKDYGFTWKRIAFRDTSIWAIDMLARNDRDEIWAGGFSEGIGDVVDVPGEGIIARYTVPNSNWEIQRDIDWGQSTRRNVWMIRHYANSSGENVVYFSTEAGFLKYEYTPTSTYRKDIPQEHRKPYFSINNGILRLNDKMNISAKGMSLHVYNLIGQRTFCLKNIGIDDLLTGFNISNLINIGFIILTNENETPILSEFCHSTTY